MGVWGTGLCGMAGEDCMEASGGTKAWAPGGGGAGVERKLPNSPKKVLDLALSKAANRLLWGEGDFLA